MKRLLKAFVYSCLLTIISLFSVGWFWRKPLQLTLILIIISGVMLLIWKSKEDLLLYIICGVAGAIAEAIAIAFGAWKYSFPTLVGIPYWLPFLWGIAALFIKKISLEIHDFAKK